MNVLTGFTIMLLALGVLHARRRARRRRYSALPSYHTLKDRARRGRNPAMAETTLHAVHSMAANVFGAQKAKPETPRMVDVRGDGSLFVDPNRVTLVNGVPTQTEPEP